MNRALAAAAAACACACACTGVRHPQLGRAATEGAIAGRARDHDTGAPLARAAIHVRAEGELAGARSGHTGPDGIYRIDHLPPGHYSVTAELAGQVLDIEHVVVHAGHPTLVDLVFTPGDPDPVHVDFGDNSDAISSYHPAHLAPGVAIVEGTVSDQATRAPLVGAAVMATGPDGTDEAVTDDLGHYRFAPVAPGTYTISAYYSIGGRGQFERRRAGIAVAAGTGVIVPLWVELAKP